MQSNRERRKKNHREREGEQQVLDTCVAAEIKAEWQKQQRAGFGQ